MDYIKTEKKWRAAWARNKDLSFDPKSKAEKFYMLEMFSYPSAANLHLGHWYNYGLSDSYARFKKMNGYNVFQPMGFDAFGLPAENYAIRTGIHPMDSTRANIAKMRVQLKNMGAMFDWKYGVVTCDPDYYKWTQWLFLQLYKKGLAYQKDAAVNWCSGCNTVIANEQVADGVCERCSSPVIRKNMKQWFFKITDYAGELLSDLEGLDWPEKTKLMQKNWIGRSSGGEIIFTTASGESFPVFTTRADTLFGVSYVVLAPEHPLTDKLTVPACRAAVRAYQADAARVSELDRLSSVKEKTGVFTGAYALNPANGERVPVYTADYVLYTYGTGAVMGVPAHDERDFAFALKYGLPVKRVINPPDGALSELPCTSDGILTESGVYSGLTSEDARARILDRLAADGTGGHKTNYRLRDWSISRQRYWGCPIPIIHCGHCGAVPVPEEQLPITLPYDVNFTPDGQSPLLRHAGYIDTTCPVCGGPAKRDADTLDTFVCSSWYYLRYPDNKNKKAAFSKKKIDAMLPVDKYVGGAEHACMHLLYARFFTKALRDLGYLSFGEPFKSLLHQGMILGVDGFKMSKNRGNVANPDTYVSKFGSDALRLYLAFGFNYTDGGPWSDDGIKSIVKFLDRVERVAVKFLDAGDTGDGYGAAEKELDYALNYAIGAVTRDTEAFSFNTSIARLMELLNAVNKYENAPAVNAGFTRGVITDMLRLLAPYAPHFSEELFARYGAKKSVFLSGYPKVDKAKLVRDETEYAVQINSKLKARLTVPSSADNAEIERLALSDERIAPLFEGRSVKKVIIIPKRLINILV
ncbi:MAG: leucine--tRNA ligase [Clostridiales bacterium]|jgi:leucyl-tRNA synthetase|nr:leucine--tRNA ligase [Clostridiales bacterium]